MATFRGDPALYRSLGGFVRDSRTEFEKILRILVEIPSVSMDPERGDAVRRCAEVAADLLRGIGARASVVRTRGNPVVKGMIRQGRNDPTVLLYNHLDVQPADPAEWRRDPFTLHRTPRGWIGRGTSDDKGPLVTALLAARYAAEHGLPLNIGFLWEMEEEMGSPSIEGFLQRRAGSLQTDSVLVSDTTWISREHPTVVYGLRGLLGMFRQNRDDPAVLLYNHLDVQPADPAEWRHDPFTLHPTSRWWGGRGTSDDKGPLVTALLAARYAAEHGLPLNIGFLWEMEEEVGSPSLEGFIRRKGRSLRADSVLVSDTSWISRGHPTVVYGLRGLLGMQLSLQTHERDLHSGSAGGVARNPLSDLGRVLSACQDPRTGRVTIPGFSDGIQPLTRAEMEGFLRSGITVEGFRKIHGITRIRPSIRSRQDLIRALMAEPTFEVHGFSGGYAGPGLKTIIPHLAEAMISFRLVPRQDPGAAAQRVREFLMQENPDLEVSVESLLEPFLGDFSGPYADAAREAMRFGFRREPVFWRTGGSIGAVTTLRRYLRVPLSLLGLSLPTDRAHGVNEHFEWRQAAGGIRMMVRYLDAIRRIPKMA